MMEEVSFTNSKGLMLKGNLYPSENKKIVIMSHGFCADKDRSWWKETAEKVNSVGYAVLRFDFSGCGLSETDVITVASEVQDLESAIEFVKSKGYEEISLIGFSLGGVVSLQLNNSDIKTMVLWAPVTDKKEKYLEYKFGPGQAEELEEKGFIIREKRGREFKIPKEYFEERESLDQKELLSKIRCPVLIIHGDADESVPLEWSKTALTMLPEGSDLEIIEGEGHLFDNAMSKVADLTKEWFESH